MKFLEKILYFQVIDNLLCKLGNVKMYIEKYLRTSHLIVLKIKDYHSHLLQLIRHADQLLNYHSFLVCSLIHILQNIFNQQEEQMRLLKQQREYKECIKAY